MNDYQSTQKFERKVNLRNEYQKQLAREISHDARQWIEANQSALEAIQETKRVRNYFESEEQIQSFAREIRDKKEYEKMALGWDKVDKNSTLTRSAHKVIPSREQISGYALGLGAGAIKD